MKLSKKESDLLKSLQQKAEAPDPAPSSRVLNISIDLGDDEQVKRGLELGLLDGGDLDDGGEGGEGGEGGGEGEEGPRRRGFFPEGGGEE